MTTRGSRAKVDLPPVVVAVRPQLHNSDCGVAVLAMATGLPYETVFQAAPQAGRDGLTPRQLQTLAARLGFSVRAERDVDWESDSGIVGIEYATQVTGHWLYLRAGTLIDPSDGTLWNADDYCTANDCTIDCFFTVISRPRRPARLRERGQVKRTGPAV